MNARWPKFLGWVLPGLLVACAEAVPSAPVWKPLWTLPLQVREQPWSLGNHFYVVAAEPGQPARLMALEPASGNALWVSEFAVASTVAFDQQRIAVRDIEGKLHVVDRLTGRPAATWPAQPRPFLFDPQQRYVMQQQGVTALDDQGQTLWRTPLGWVEITAGEIADGVMVMRGRPAVTSGRPDRRAIVALDIASGKILWQATSPTYHDISPVWIRQGRAWYIAQGQSRARHTTTKSGDKTTTTTVAGVDEHQLIGRNLVSGEVLATLPVNGLGLQFGQPLGWDGDDLVIQAYADVDNIRRPEILVVDSAKGQVRRRFFVADYQPNQTLLTGPDGWVMTWRKRHRLLNEGGDAIPNSGLCRVDRNNGALLACTKVFAQSTVSAPEMARGVALVASYPFSFNGQTYGGPAALQGYALK